MADAPFAEWKVHQSGVPDNELQLRSGAIVLSGEIVKGKYNLTSQRPMATSAGTNTIAVGEADDLPQQLGPPCSILGFGCRASRVICTRDRPRQLFLDASDHLRRTIGNLSVIHSLVCDGG